MARTQKNKVRERLIWLPSGATANLSVWSLLNNFLFPYSFQATNYHLGTLKAKLAKLRNELFVEQSGGSGGGGGEGFDVARNGDARLALIGFPSVGKSSLLCKKYCV